MFDGAPPVGRLMQKELELIGLPAVACGFVGADVELDILDQVGDPGAPAGSGQNLSHFWFFQIQRITRFMSLRIKKQ